MSIKKSHRVIHMNEIVERAKSARINEENKKIVMRLMDTSCLITNKNAAKEFYQRQSKYKNLRRRYQ